ncbi:MAG TPA: pilus assembly protein TadG-related protein [Hyphomonadaceae bacterium]
MTVMMLGIMAVVAFVAGGVVDYMSLSNQKRDLQGVADRAAIAAAQELVVFKGTDDRVQSVAASFVSASYTGSHETNAQIIDDGRAVRVTITADAHTYFPGPIGSVESVDASAVAEMAGGGYVCMVGLDSSAPSTLDMSDKARVTAEKCAIYSNSKNSASLKLHSLARVKAELVCVAGGISGPESAVTPNKPITDCPVLQDPLRDRPEPKVGLIQCDNVLGKEGVLGKNGVLGKGLAGKDGLLGKDGAVLGKDGLLSGGDLVGALAPGLLVTGKDELEPGVYCGGINVIGGDVKLKPGTYILNNGGLVVANGGKLQGENVGFYLTGVAGLSTIQFAPSSTVSLTAPKTGDMSGMLFFEDRDVLFKFPHIIASNNARNLVGTIYLPGNTLEINSTDPIADQSDYTVIIAKKFEMKDGPELVLNTDYENSPIPVPEGVGNKARPTVRLAE